MVYLECSSLKAREKNAESYDKKKYKETKEKLSDFIENVLDVTFYDCDDCGVLMQELKENLQKIELSEEKYRVLTIASHSWTIKEPSKFFGK